MHCAEAALTTGREPLPCLMIMGAVESHKQRQPARPNELQHILERSEQICLCLCGPVSPEDPPKVMHGRSNQGNPARKM